MSSQEIEYIEEIERIFLRDESRNIGAKQLGSGEYVFMTQDPVVQDLLTKLSYAGQKSIYNFVTAGGLFDGVTPE